MAVSDEDLLSIKQNLSKAYILIPKANWYSLFGGAIAALGITGYVSYQGALAAIRTTGVQEALHMIAIARVKVMAGANAIDSIRAPYASGLDSLRRMKQQLVAIPVVKSGCFVRPSAGTVNVPFGYTFTSRPAVILAPEWRNPHTEVHGIDTINDVQTDHFTMTGSNSAAEYYTCWVAIGSAPQLS